jgi:DNA-binding IscR family transcriptional regulator
VHAVMLRAEKAMRAELAKETLASVANTFSLKAPAEFSDKIAHWMQDRFNARTSTRTSRSK